MVEIQCSIILPWAKGNITHELSIKTQSAGNKITRDRGKISARSFLYRFTGCLDLARSEGQKQQRLLQAGNTRLEITPIFTEITLLFPQKPVKFLADVRKQQEFKPPNNQKSIPQSPRIGFSCFPKIWREKSNQIHVV